MKQIEKKKKNERDLGFHTSSEGDDSCSSLSSNFVFLELVTG